MPILQNKELQWDLYDVSQLKRDFDLKHGYGAPSQLEERGSPILSNFWHILNFLGLNAPTLNFYLDIQLITIGMLLLNIHLFFESVPNALAELARYSDRQFYVDWWNAVTVEEFIQKWFKLPYIFFYRHGFVRLVLKYQMNQTLARIITFVFYSVSMELVLILSLGIYKCYTFKLLMIALLWHVIQLRFPPIDPAIFNSSTLFGFLVAVPLIACLYCREYLNIGTHQVYVEAHINKLME